MIALTNTPALKGMLTELAAKGGPETQDYPVLDSLFDQIAAQKDQNVIAPEVLAEIYKMFHNQEFADSTLHGHIRNKPYGYAGDFMIIDKIYRKHMNPDPRFEKWDIFWNNHTAARAVRNRKEYFKRLMGSKLESGKHMRLLNVASGPARDLAELYENTNPEQLTTVCVEADNRAIEYAKKLNQIYNDRITFINQNIFKFRTEEKFDTVWSAGLFDYFDNRMFVKLLAKFMSWTKPGGEVVIGNFSPNNPSRNCMEIMGEWFLIHRSVEELTAMAIEAGAKPENIRVGSELCGVNLFLHVTV